MNASGILKNPEIKKKKLVGPYFDNVDTRMLSYPNKQSSRGMYWIIYQLL